jgi:hypothetical protein
MKYTAQQLLNMGPHALRKIARRNNINPSDYERPAGFQRIDGLVNLAAALAELNVAEQAEQREKK